MQLKWGEASVHIEDNIYLDMPRKGIWLRLTRVISIYKVQITRTNHGLIRHSLLIKAEYAPSQTNRVHARNPRQ